MLPRLVESNLNGNSTVHVDEYIAYTNNRKLKHHNAHITHEGVVVLIKQ